jgi:hypothetical protein
MKDTDIAAASQVRDLVHGRWKAQALAATMRLGLPELLRNGPLPQAAMVAGLGVDEDACGRLLRLMVTLGVLVRSTEGYALSADGRRLLDEHPNTLARDARYTLSPALCVAWDGIEDAVRSGVNPYRRIGCDSLAGYLRQEPAQARLVREYQAGVGRHNAAAAAAAGPTEGRLVALGAANGPLVAELLAGSPSLRAVLVVEPGDTVAAGHDRLEIVYGRSIPKGADCYLLVHVLRELPDEDAGRLLRRVAQAMGGGSTLVVLAAALDDLGSHLLAAYLDVQQFLVGDGRERTEAGYRHLLETAGLTVESVRPAPGRPGVRVLTARR